MKKIKSLYVYYQNRKVGTLARYKEHLAAFEYDKEWLKGGFSISPFSLPLQPGVFIPKLDPFEGLFGVFSDSLPDGWGRLLVDRLMRKNGLQPRNMGNIERLVIVGKSGMGALCYEPDWQLGASESDLELDKIAEECSEILRTDHSDHLDELFCMGGSSGGARPKILVTVDGEEWLIKFPSREDDRDIGQQEYRYALCAKACGIEMAETRLFDSKKCGGYFGTKRFDRSKTADGEEIRTHMISASALLETSHRTPNLDYELLMKLTMRLTEDFSELEKLYRLMCFNVFSHNRDDHSKNFSYLYDEKSQTWRLSPAYDLTYSFSLGGEHATTIHGNGADPGLTDLLAVAEQTGISRIRAKEIAERVEACVWDHLRCYLEA